MTNPLVERDGHLAIVTINRPEKLNALDHDTITALRRELEDTDGRRR